MHRRKVKLLLWLATVLFVLVLIVVPVLATEQFTLTVEKDGDGTGTVISDDGKINCGADCEETYETFTSGKLGPPLGVTLTATPDEGSVFTAWGQDCGCAGDLRSKVGFDPGTGPCTVGMAGGNRTCTATFGLPVGGIAMPVNKLGLLAPWLGLAALASLASLASLATLTVALVRRRRG